MTRVTATASDEDSDEAALVGEDSEEDSDEGSDEGSDANESHSSGEHMSLNEYSSRMGVA